jgi:hypothetical protein
MSGDASERQRPGRWCWCLDVPEGQEPHDCAGDEGRFCSAHVSRRWPGWEERQMRCRGYGAHVHPWPRVRVAAN